MPIRLSDIPDKPRLRLSDVPEIGPVNLSWSGGGLGPARSYLGQAGGGTTVTERPLPFMRRQQKPEYEELPGPRFPSGTPKDIRPVETSLQDAASGIYDDVKTVVQAADIITAGKSPYKKDRALWKEIPARLRNVRDRVISPILGRLMHVTGVLDYKDLKEDIASESEKFGGFGPAATPAAAEATKLAVEWGYIYPKMFRAAGVGGEAIGKMPRVREGIEALRRLGGIEKIASKYPRLISAAERSMKAFGKGEAVGQALAGLEAIGEDETALQIIANMNKRGALLGGTAFAFEVASSIDTAHYVSKLRGELIARTKARYSAKIKPLVGSKVPGAKAGITSLVGQERRELGKIDDIVAAVEQKLIRLKSGKLYKAGQEKLDPMKEAERIAKYGLEEGRVYSRGPKELKKGLAAKLPFIKMPTTRTGEVIETTKEVAGKIKGIAKGKIVTPRPSAEATGLKAGPKAAPTPVPPPAPRGPIRLDEVPDTPVVEKVTPTPAPQAVAEGKVAQSFKEIVKDAETGKPFADTLFRTETKGRRDYTRGVFFSGKDYADKLQPILEGKVASEKVMLNNPLVVSGNHEALTIAAKDGNVKAQKLLVPDDSFPVHSHIKSGASDTLIEKVIAEYARSKGFDGIIKKWELEIQVISQAPAPQAPAKPIALTEKRVVPVEPAPPQTKKVVVPPEKAPGLTRDEITVVGTETAKALREAQLEGAKVGYKVGDKNTRAEMRTKIVELRTYKKLSQQLRNETRKLIQKAFGQTVPKKFLTLLGYTKNAKDVQKAIDAVAETLDKIEQKQALAELRKLTGKIKSRIGKTMQERGIRPEYARKLNTLIDAFSTRKLSAWRIKDIQSLRSYLTDLKEGIANDSTIDADYRAEQAEFLIPESRLKKLGEITKSSIHLLSAEDIRTITAELQRLVHLNDTKNKILNRRTMRKVSEYLKRAVAQQNEVKSRAKLREPSLDIHHRPTGFLSKAWSFIGGTKNQDIPTLCHTIEGGKEGAASEILVDNFLYGREIEATHIKKVHDYVQSVLGQYKITSRDLARISPLFQRALKTQTGKTIRSLFGANILRYPVKIGGRTIRLTKAEMMSVYMHSLADFDLDAMFNQGVAVMEGNVRPARMEPEELAAIVKRLTPKETTLCQMFTHVAETINKPAINEVSMDLKGIEIANVDNYYPVERYKRGRVAGHQEFQINLMESEGFLQERIGGKEPIVIRDFFEVFMATTKGVAEYAGLAKPFRSAKTLLAYKPWASAVDSKGHEEHRHLINELIKRTEQHPRVKDYLGGLFSKITRGATRAVLADPGIFAGQYTSALLYRNTDIPHRYLTVSLPSKKEVDRCAEAFPWAWQRRHLGVSSIATADVSKTDATLRMFTGKADIINLFTSPISRVDMRAITYGWRACERWVTDTTNLKPGTNEFYEEVNKRAHKAISQSQPMFEVENRSVNTSTANALTRSFFLFRSYVDQTLQMLTASYTAFQNGHISWAKMLEIWGTVFTVYATYILLKALTDALVFGRKKEPEDIALDIALSPLKVLALVGYPAQRAAKGVIATRTGKKYAYRYFDTPFEGFALSVLNEVSKASAEFARGASYIGTGETYQSGPNKGKLKSEVILSRAVWDLAMSLGKLAGLPTPAVTKLKWGYLKKEEEEKPLAFKKRPLKKRVFKKRAG